MFICFRFTQDERNVVPPSTEDTAATAVAGPAFALGHGIEVAIEFKPVEHPTEPLDNDRPIQCPLPEPSILNVRSSVTWNVLTLFLCLYVSLRLHLRWKTLCYSKKLILV